MLSCSACGISYEIPSEFREKRLEDGKTFYCPNGHPQHFTDSTRKKLERMEEEKDLYLRWYKNGQEQKATLHRRISALHGVITKLRDKARRPVPMSQAEQTNIINALKYTDGHRKKAAKILGISERTLYRRLKE